MQGLKFFFCAVLTAVGANVFGQASFQNDPLGQDGSRIITTAVPFLTISPDARAGGMADIGAATTPDMYSIHWNAAKLPFQTKVMENGTTAPLDMGFAISFTPWLKRLVNDMYITNITGFTRLRKEEAVGFSMTYFDLGDMQFTDENGAEIKKFNPKEYNITAVYSRQLSENLGIAGGLKFIHSNLSGNLSLGAGTTSKPGNTAAADVSLYYRKKIQNIPGLVDAQGGEFAWGVNISNLGGKISYTNNDQSDFIPTNLRLGASFSVNVDEHNKVALAFDVNKLLVPTPPILDTNGNIVSGKDPNRGFLSGVFGSFGDAPGGFKEELQEFIIGIGAEYWYDNLFAVRGGYFSEHALKGNRKYFTLGLGIRYSIAGFDFAYLIPRQQNHPLAETLRFSLSFNFDKKKRTESVTEDE